MAKKSRKELLKQDDAFIQAANQSAVWFHENRRLMVAMAIVGFVLIAGIWGGVEYMRVRDTRASDLFNDAMETMEAQIVAGSEEPDAPKADPSADPPTFSDEAARNKAALAGFEKVIDEGGRSGVTQLARFYVSDLHQRLGELDKARTGFASLVDTLSSKDSLYFLAVERTAYLFEQAKNYDDAIGVLQRLVKDGDKDAYFFADYAWFHQARLYQAKGDDVRAKALLEKVAADFPDSGVTAAVKERLALLEGVSANAAAAKSPAESEAAR
ncbi:MAG: tetratricopeptide repeat protein [Myxococcota bacterium]